MKGVELLRFSEARETVLARVGESKVQIEQVSIEDAQGRVLAADILADRDYPPFHRATRDGYAVRAADRGPLRIIGEVPAGKVFSGKIGAGECVSIMTGAPAPEGADAVVMVEYTRVENGQVVIDRPVAPGENIVPRGSESPPNQRVLEKGAAIGYPEIAMLASVGRRSVPVFARPRVAILSTGDEVVEIDREPLPHQIRNSNSFGLRAQVAAAGGDPVQLPVAPDERVRLRELLEQGLEADLLLVSGGVSMGKYDLVEGVLGDLGAEIFFDAVAIQPGRPLVFGRARGKFFFGLPGNPLSTMVCFELFARPALERLAGRKPQPLVFPKARLLKMVRTKPGLTRFLPARLAGASFDPTVELSGWQGSGDVAALVRSNCFLVVPEDRPELPEGEWVHVWPMS